MRTRNAWATAALLFLFLFLSGTVAAQAVVSACGNDAALRAAVAAGGRITFACGPQPTVIDIATSITVDRAVQIDGGGRVALRGSGTAPLFVAKAALALTGLVVRNPSPQAVGIVSSTSDVTLRSVETRDTATAYVARSLDAQDSLFEANGRSASAPGVLINAEQVLIMKSVFRNNTDHPLGGGAVAAGRMALSRELVLDDVTFEANRASVLAIDAALTVRNSRFTNNGSMPAESGGPWLCCGGAITAVASRVDIRGSEFSGNGSMGAGGAVHAIGSELRIVSTQFARNRARAGGAVFSWAQPVKDARWSTLPAVSPLQPRLSLARVRFRDNVAQLGGGALAWAGVVEGNEALFAKNTAPVGGAAAHWTAVELPAEFASVFAELDAMTLPSAQALRLARGVFIENRARTEGAAVHGGTALVALGSGLLARNVVEVTGAGAAVESARALDLANVSIADNAAGGVRLQPGGGSAELRNTIVLRNAHFGCRIEAGSMRAPAANLQFPSTDCTGAATRDPALAATYKPELGSHAGIAGNMEACLTAPLVAGVDLVGVGRGNRGICAIGAYEADPRVDDVTGWPLLRYPWLRWVVLLIFLLFLWLGWCVMRRRRKRCLKPQAKSSAMAEKDNA